MRPYDSINHNLTFSQLRSSTGHDLFGSQADNYHSLPHITQPLLARYRNERQPNELVIEQSSSFWCSLFGMQNRSNLTLCKCDRTEQGHCELIMKWIEQYYDWKHDPKFAKAYHNYTRRNIEIFVSDQQLSNRLDRKLQILGVRLGESYHSTLLRICKNYLKHTIYYNKSQLLTRQNDLWMWFLLGVFYHIGSSVNGSKENVNHEEEIMFWAVDLIMNHFGDLTRKTMHLHIRKTMDLMIQYFPNWHGLLVQHYGIDLEPIIYEWVNEMMMGYMGIQSIGFFIDCLFKAGWIYVYKIILSYFEKRMEKMQSDQVFQSVTERQSIMKLLMNCNEEWPLIFCNANSFVLKKPGQSK